MVSEIVATSTPSPLLVCFGGQGSPGIVDFEDLLICGTAREPVLQARPEDIACLIFTSGL